MKLFPDSELFTLRNVMRIHAIFCIIIGFLCIIIPHNIYVSSVLRDGPYKAYDHIAHEYIRLYGCLTLSLGWIVERSKSLRDGALIKIITEAFSICYALQCIVMIRAHISYAKGHTFPYMHVAIAILFGLISILYGYIRLFKKPKDLELPSVMMRDD